MSSSSKRSARETWRAIRICAGVGGSGSSSGGSGGSATAAGAETGAAARSTMSGPLQESLQALPHRPRAPGQQLPPLAGSSLPSLSSEHLIDRTRPSKSAVQVDAEAETGAAQVNHVALVVSER